MNPTTARAAAPVDLRSLPEYAPTTYVDFSKPEHREAFEKALAQVRKEIPAEIPIVIDGKREKGEGVFESHNPARPDEIVARVQSASKDQAQRAVEGAARAFASWSR